MDAKVHPFRPPALSAAPAPIKINFTEQPLADAATKLPAATGACFFDFDNDGKPDLFLVSATNDGSAHLLHNLGDGKFADVTQATGIHLTGAGLGCVAGDYDNDGHTDLAVCLSDGVHLLHNKDGKFADVTETVGIRRLPGCVGLTFVDYDHDGDLDIFIAGFVDLSKTPSSDSRQPSTYPDDFPGAPNMLLRNDGNGKFTDITAAAKVSGAGGHAVAVGQLADFRAELLRVVGVVEHLDCPGLA